MAIARLLVSHRPIWLLDEPTSGLDAKAESMFAGLLKAHLANRPIVLRSKRPALVGQEFYALLLTHAAIRRLMTQAAAGTQQAANDLSFIHAVRVLQRRLPQAGAISPCA